MEKYIFEVIKVSFYAVVCKLYDLKKHGIKQSF